MLNYESFAVRVSEDDIPNLINTLRVTTLSLSLSFVLNLQTAPNLRLILI